MTNARALYVLLTAIDYAASALDSNHRIGFITSEELAEAREFISSALTSDTSINSESVLVKAASFTLGLLEGSSEIIRDNCDLDMGGAIDVLRTALDFNQGS